MNRWDSRSRIAPCIPPIDALGTALWLAGRGLWVVPITPLGDPLSPNPGKAPIGRGWGTRRLSTRAPTAGPAGGTASGRSHPAPKDSSRWSRGWPTRRSPRSGPCEVPGCGREARPVGMPWRRWSGRRIGSARPGQAARLERPVTARIREQVEAPPVPDMVPEELAGEGEKSRRHQLPRGPPPASRFEDSPPRLVRGSPPEASEAALLSGSPRFLSTF
jgi:hypothetical protein